MVGNRFRIEHYSHPVNARARCIHARVQHGKYIGPAIESVLAQTEVDFELVVVDDGSTDDTLEVARSFHDPRIRVIENSANNGIAFCHNLVTRMSDSRAIAHLDSDDLARPGALAQLMQCLRNDSKTAYAHCNYDFIDGSGALLGHGKLRARRRLSADPAAGHGLQAGTDHARGRGGQSPAHLPAQCPGGGGRVR